MLDCKVSPAKKDIFYQIWLYIIYFGKRKTKFLLKSETIWRLAEIISDYWATQGKVGEASIIDAFKDLSLKRQWWVRVITLCKRVFGRHDENVSKLRYFSSCLSLHCPSLNTPIHKIFLSPNSLGIPFYTEYGDVTNSWLDDKLPLAGLWLVLVEVYSLKKEFKTTLSSLFQGKWNLGSCKPSSFEDLIY